MPNPTSKLNLVINGATTQLDIHDANAVDLTSNQTVGGNKEFTGTTTAHDVVPSATDTYNFGSSSYQWNNAYIKSLTINGVATGDILTHNASEFVNVTGAQTIAGVKSFKDTIIRNIGNFNVGVAPAAQTTCYVLRHTNNDGTHTANSINSYVFTTGESMCELTQIPCIGSTARTWFRTNTDGTYSIYSYTKNGSLGTPGYKWKDVQTEKINNLNPGALSLPNKSSYINIDTTNWDLTCSNQGVIANYTVEESGWLLLQIRHASADIVDLWLVTDSIRMNSKSTLNTLDNRNFNMISLPLVKGETLRIFGNASQYVAGRVIDYARIYRGLGQ